MDQGNNTVETLLSRLTRPESGYDRFASTGYASALPLSTLRLLPPGRRAEELGRQLRGSRFLADHPELHLGRILERKPLLLETARELLGPADAGDVHNVLALPVALLDLQYQLELAALSNCCRRESAVDLLNVCATAALDTLFEMLLSYWHYQLPPPARWWLETHTLYQLVCAKGAETPGHTPRDASARAVRAAYLKPQLLGSLNPARFRPAELRQIVAFIGRYADRAELGGSDGLLCIDPESSRPPAYFGRQKSPHCWRLCVRGLVQALDLDADTTTKLMPRLKSDLGRYWTKRQVRTELHRRTVQPGRMTIGLEAAHQLLSGCDDDDALLEHTLTIEPSAAGTQYRRSSSAFPVVCIDRSSAGARFRLTGEAGAVLPGTLITTLLGDPPECLFGLIRWVQRDADSSVLAGAQWLLPAPQPCAVERLDQRSVTPVLRAFFRGEASGTGELLVPTGIFRANDRVRVHTGAALLPMTVTAVFESTFHVSRLGTRVESDSAAMRQKIPSK